MGARRRSKRLWLSVPVLVSGLDAHSQRFREFSCMLSVNKYGGLVSLAAAVQKGQTILLVNCKTGEEQECRLVHIGSAENGQGAMGIEFTRPAPEFWQIGFPTFAHSEVRGTKSSVAVAS
jgi:hypothetical protein